MALEFLSSYFQVKKVSLEQAGTSASTLVNKLAELGPNFLSSSQSMRDQQAAYNTIEVQKGVSGIDYSLNKVQALASHRFLTVDYSSAEIDVSQATENSFSECANTLPEGVFFIRTLKPEDNEKLEAHGHSLIYIKEQGLGLFYDSNYGLLNLAPSEHSKTILSYLKIYVSNFQTTKARFYRVKQLSGV